MPWSRLCLATALGIVVLAGLGVRSDEPAKKEKSAFVLKVEGKLTADDPRPRLEAFPALFQTGQGGQVSARGHHLKARDDRRLPPDRGPNRGEGPPGRGRAPRDGTDQAGRPIICRRRVWPPYPDTVPGPFSAARKRLSARPFAPCRPNNSVCSVMNRRGK